MLLYIVTTSIRDAGRDLVNLTVSIKGDFAKQGLLIIQRMLTKLPDVDVNSFVEYDMKFICSLFLECEWSLKPPASVAYHENEQLLDSQDEISHRNVKFVDSNPQAVVATTNFLTSMNSAYSSLGQKGAIASALLHDPSNAMNDNAISTRGSEPFVSVIVCGSPLIGKSSVITSAIDLVIGDYNKEMARLKIADKGGTQNLEPLLKFQGLIDPFSLPSNNDGNSSTDMLAKVEPQLRNLLQTLSKGPGVTIIHFDVNSSYQLMILVPNVTQIAFELGIRVKFVWECCDLIHLDPALLATIPIVTITDRSFTLDNVINKHADTICQRLVYHQIYS